jgi:cytochrome c peroxidase
MTRAVKIISCLSFTVFVWTKGLYTGAGDTPLKIEYPEYFGNRIFIPEDNNTTVQGVYLGRMLFYETSLSANDSLSCSSCHQQRFAFADGQQFSKGFDGTLQLRNTMSLANLLWVRNFFWDGRANGLEKQAETPLTNPHEMGQSLEMSVQKLRQKKIYTPLFRNAFGSDTITGTRILKALAQFERTLVSANSRYDQYLQGRYKPTPSELNGIALFYSHANPGRNVRGTGCDHCHGGPKTYNELFHNNGLELIPKDEGREKITGQSFDRGRFRVVTLRNIALTAPYMHDGRFTTLEQVVDHYNEHIVRSPLLSPFLQNNSNTENGESLALTIQEKRDLVAFLHMLTDSSFITDKRFSNPFLK